MVQPRESKLTIDGRPHPTIILADHDDLGDLGGREVGKAQPDKLAGLVQLVHGLEGLGERRRPVRGVEIDDLNLVTVPR